jgi:hypothetical protein
MVGAWSGRGRARTHVRRGPAAYHRPRKGERRWQKREEGMRTDLRSFLLGALLVAVLVLGYLYWERRHNSVEIRLPSITIEKR